MCLDGSLTAPVNCLNTGGITRLLLAKKADITSGTFTVGTLGATQNQLTAVVGTTPNIYEIEFDSLSDAGGTTNKSDGRATSFGVDFIVSVLDRSQAAHNFFQKLGACCPVVVFIEEASGIRKALGLTLNIISHTYTVKGLQASPRDITGNNTEDPARYEVSITGTMGSLGIAMNDTVWNALEAAIVA